MPTWPAHGKTKGACVCAGSIVTSTEAGCGVGAGVGEAYRVTSGACGASAMGRVQTAVTATIARQALSTHK